jgi:uroporphyrinogen decarboxylase
MTPQETNNGDSPVLIRLFGLDDHFAGHHLFAHCGMNPTFEEKILEQQGETVVVRQAGGIVARRFLNESDACSIPQFLSFPVTTPEDWREIKARYRLDDPARNISAERIAAARAAVAAGEMTAMNLPGFYWLMRQWMGVENLSLAFYDYPDMIHEMTDLIASMAVRAIAQWPADLPIDEIRLDEDLAYRNGPLLSPRQFREFLQPAYHRVMTAARARGCELGMVDSDGNVDSIIPMWLEEGVNVIHPLEIAAGTDAMALRRRFGRDLRLCGGVDKRALIAGGSAIDKEIERIRPLFEDGLYIPHVDHRVPPDVSYANYMKYLEAKRKLLATRH